jgi:hypothetical protein
MCYTYLSTYQNSKLGNYLEQSAKHADVIEAAGHVERVASRLRVSPPDLGALLEQDLQHLQVAAGARSEPVLPDDKCCLWERPVVL